MARSQGAGSPFGQATRMRVLEAYFARAGEVTAENAWEHVYRCLLWMNQGAGLAHIYDSNHMQPGGNFHSRAIRFTDELCRLFGVTRAQLPAEIDHLFKGCVEEWKRRRSTDIDTELESELVAVIEQVLRGEGVADSRVRPVARHLEVLSRDFFTIGNKRKNALGEGFEDLLYLLLVRVAGVPPEKIALRRPVSELPGFRRAPPRLPGSRPASRYCDFGRGHHSRHHVREMEHAPRPRNPVPVRVHRLPNEQDTIDGAAIRAHHKRI